MTANPASVRVRPMTLEDVDAVYDLAQRLPHAPHWPRHIYVEALDVQRSARRTSLAAVDATGKLVGFCIGLAVPPQAEIESIAVAPEHHRQGIARCLIKKLFNEWREQAITEVILEVRESNATAQALYSTLGFSVCGRRSRYYVDPEEDALLLSRSLV